MTTSETTDDEVDMAAPIGPMAAAEAEAWLCEIDAARGDCDPSAEVRAGYRVEAALRGVVAAHAARVAAEREADGLGRDLVAVAKARDEAVADAKRLREREEHFARALSVADGGQYRADWPGAIGRLLAERDALRARAESAEAEVARLRAEVEALKAAQASARREGAEAMREACAEAADYVAASLNPAAAIRALPLPEAPPDASTYRRGAGAMREACAQAAARVASAWARRECRCACGSSLAGLAAAEACAAEIRALPIVEAP